MRKMEWHNGPPPHVGWWNASVTRDHESWRWWNGAKWSRAAFPGDTLRVVEREAAGITIAQPVIEWTTYWPKNARVPRVKP